MPKIWLYQGSEYTWVLIMSWFWICQGYNTGLWLCLNYSGCAWICVNMPGSAWMVFALQFPFVIPCLNERVVTYFNFHMNLEVIVIVIIWRSFKFGVTFRGSDGGGGGQEPGVDIPLSTFILSIQIIAFVSLNMQMNWYTWLHRSSQSELSCFILKEVLSQIVQASHHGYLRKIRHVKSNPCRYMIWKVVVKIKKKKNFYCILTPFSEPRSLTM